MASEFDLDREVAEKVLKRAMAPIRELLENAKDYEDTDVCHDGIAYGTLRELDRDLGVLGLTLATRYREQVEYQTALGVMSAENVRLQNTVEQLTSLASKYKAEGENLADALQKTRTVNLKLRELTSVEKSGFHS